MKNIFNSVFFTVSIGFAAPVFAQAIPETLTAKVASAPAKSFEQGAYQTLLAVENLFQTRHKYGIGQSIGMIMGMGDQNQLVNQTPQARTPETFTKMITTFLSDLDTARATLTQTDTTNAQPFILNVDDIWLDMNSNGTVDPGENLSTLIAQVILNRNELEAFNEAETSIAFRFDGADHAWLMAYTHMISGLGEVVLAFNPTSVFNDLIISRAALKDAPTIPFTYDVAAIQSEIAALSKQQENADPEIELRTATIKPLRSRRDAIRDQLHKATTDTNREFLKAEQSSLQKDLRDHETALRTARSNKRFLRNEIRAARAKLPREFLTPDEQRRRDRNSIDSIVSSEMRDAIYALLTALRQQPDAERIKKMELHWRAMLDQNRKFWAVLPSETDNELEWIPNAHQTSALGIQVSDELAKSWQNVLVDAEAVLDGRLLVPHPLLPDDMGINLSAWLDNPSPLDLISMLHGRAAFPYAAHGPKISAQSWSAFTRLSNGRAGGFAMFFN